MGASRETRNSRARPDHPHRRAGRSHAVSAGNLVAFGDNAILAVPRTGRVAVLNPPARFACEAFAAGRPFAQIVTDYARRYGIAPGRAEQDLRELRRGLARITRRSPLPPAATGPAAAACPPDLEAICAPGPRAIRLTVHGSRRLARLLVFLLLPVRTTASARRHLRVTRCGRAYDISCDGKLLTRTDNLLLARSEVLRHLLLLSHGRRRWLAFLHAAAIAAEGRAWLIAGSSGSGKSTLAAALLREGFGIATDDYAPLEAGTGLLHRVPFAMGIKDASIALLHGTLPAIDRIPAVRFRNREVRYVAPPVLAPERLAVGGLLFPLYDPQAAPELSPLSPEQAFTLCAQGGGWYEGSARRLAELVQWFRQRPAWLITYPDTRSALDLVVPLLGSTR